MDRLIREATERGEWDDGAYRGRPLPRAEDEAWAGDMALANRVLRNAGVAPPWIEADRALRRLLEERDSLVGQAGRTGALAAERLRRRLEQLVAEANRLVEQLALEAPTPRQQRPRLRLEEELAAFDAARATRAHEPSPRPGRDEHP
jgi:hypothetical protein